jgi:hypothetical protein
MYVMLYYSIIMTTATQTPNTIYRKLEELESELQRLKIETYFSLPQKPSVGRYAEKAILQALKATRDQIWRDRYAKKVKSLS